MTDDERLKKLTRALSKAKFNAAHARDLHPELTTLTVREIIASTAIGKSPSASEVIGAAETLHIAARTLKDLLHWDVDDLAEPQGPPALLARLGLAFETEATRHNGFGNPTHPQSEGGISGWHPAQFSLWRQHLVTD